jgi:hypothetical protein
MAGKPRGRTWGILALALLALAALTYWPLFSRGGFAIDDWAQAARILDPSQGQSPLASELAVCGARFFQAIYVWVLFSVLGTDGRAHMIVDVTLALAVAGLLFATLCMYRLPILFAGCAAALYLVLPVEGVARAWEAVSTGQIGVGLFLVGLLVAARAFALHSGRLHVVSFVLFALAVFEQELTIPWVALSVLWYLPLTDRRAALRRWVPDAVLAVLAVIATAIFPAPAQGHTPADTWLAHGRQLAHGVLDTIWDTLTVYSAPASVAAGLAAVLVAAALLAALSRRGGESVRRAARVGAYAAVATAAAYVLYVPANPALLPDLPGPLGRVSVAAGLPLAVLLATMAWAVALAAGAIAGNRRARMVEQAVFGAGLAALIAGAALQTRDEMHAWSSAAAAERSVLTVVAGLAPHPPRAATLVVFGRPADVELRRGEAEGRLTIFSEPWVMTAALRAEYGRGDVFGLTTAPGDAFDCAAGALIVHRPVLPVAITAVTEQTKSLYGLPSDLHTIGSLYNIPSGAYGRVVVVDLARHTAATPADARACRAAISAASAA